MTKQFGEVFPSDRWLRRSGKRVLDSGACGDATLYHVTYADLLPAIRQHGLISDQSANFEGFDQWSTGKVFFAAGEDAMDHWREVFLTSQRLRRPMRFANMLVLRVRPDSRVYSRLRRDAKSNHTCSFYVLGRVEPEDLEMMNERDEWEALVFPAPTKARKRSIRAKKNCAKRSWLEVARGNPLRRPLPAFRVFQIPWGADGLAVGVLDGRDTIGGLTLRPVRGGYRVQAGAAVRGYGPLLYDAAARLLGRPIFPSTSQSDDARRFWGRLGGRVEPLTSADWQEKYGVPLEALVLDATNISANAMDALREAIFEAEDTAQDAEDQGYLPIEKRRPVRLYREQREIIARQRVHARPTVDPYKVSKRKTRSNPRRARQALRNPTATAQPLFIDVLAHLHALKWVYWTTHWTAAGPNFYGTHLLLQRLYEGKKGGPAIDDQIDQLGERMVAYFGPAAVQPLTVQQRSSTLIGAAHGGDPLRALLRLEDSLQAAIRKAWDAEQTAGADRSLGIDDALMSLANERDTARYLLKRTLAT